MLYDLYELLLSCVTGITKALVRFALVCGVTLFSLPRMDVSLFPAWLDYYVALDSGARAYHSLIVSYHQHNNPVMRVVVWLLQENAAQRRAGAAGFVPLAKRRVGNRFWKLYMMHRTPELRNYTAAGSYVPLEVVHKAAKKKDVELLRKEILEITEQSLGEQSLRRALVQPAGSPDVAQSV